MIGNMNTFKNSKRGEESWLPYFELLKVHGHLYDGLPVKCEQHPTRVSLLKVPSDFDNSCPDGGCAEMCGALLECGLHTCNRRCHRLQDHSQIQCASLVEKSCDRHHKTQVQCSAKSVRCAKCIEEDRAQERRIRRDLDLERTRLVREKAYAETLQQLQDGIDHHRRLLRYKSQEEEQQKTLSQHREQLDSLRTTVLRLQQHKEEESSRKAKTTQTRDASKEGQPTDFHNAKVGKSLPSKAREEWSYCKETEKASSPALDELMDMIGLEEVKATFLDIKSTVDTKIRQNVSVASQRFGCSLLGNPGTGM